MNSSTTPSSNVLPHKIPHLVSSLSEQPSDPVPVWAKQHLHPESWMRLALLTKMQGFSDLLIDFQLNPSELINNLSQLYSTFPILSLPPSSPAGKDAR
jgi:hypothetical protein